MRFEYLGRIGRAAIALLVLGIAAVVLAVLVPGEAALPLAGFALIMLAGLGMFAYGVLTIVEIYTSKNNNGWKAFWIIAIIVAGIVAVAVYDRVAKKDLR